ncbi:unnamed protein product [Mytilus edulis]|uniref:Vertnin n=1 Tax=Mytilus edulis TaxID=6550 RepID=A0A8S3TFE0_MYTED|nr:unnamed protein product [Mytilus edulis]
MPLTNAEKQRRYREKRDSDPNRRAEFLAICKSKYQSDIGVGKRKRIIEMTPREQRKQRKEWRKIKSKQRKRKKSNHTILTPPSSPQPALEQIPPEHHSTRRKKRLMAKCYRDNDQLRLEIAKQKRLAHRLQMRLLRLKRKSSLNTPTGQDTPRSKARKLLRHWSTEKGEGSRAKRRLMKNQAKKALQFQYTLNAELMNKYRSKNKGKQALSQIIRGKLMRKYKIITEAVNEFRFTAGRQRQKKGSLSKRLTDRVCSFYERDDISRITPGIKDTVTKNGIKKQRRVMTESIEIIHERFILENTDIKISYPTFCRMRPFWVQPPKDSDRETCACKYHENMQFLVNSLHGLNCLPSKRLQEIVKMFACDINKMDCMYGRCMECKDVILQSETDSTINTEWFQWKTKKETRLINNQEKEVTLTVKEKVTDSIDCLIDTFSSEMQRFKVHTFNITNQFNHYRKMKENLKENEVLIHIDFAENFLCKLSTEIQSMHFGASKQQITLHTGVYYTKGRTQTFCGVSDCLDHNPSAIWAFLDPILDRIINENKNVDTLHFFSDGPCSQYRQKGNFFLLSKEMSKRGLQATWNFHESGHGKGVPDGVGGTLKRTANDLVLRGKDITSAKSFVESIQEQESLVMLYEVVKEHIAEKTHLLASQNLKAVPGTFKLHQIRTSICGVIWYRDVSCTCVESCSEYGHNWKKAVLVVNSKHVQEKDREDSNLRGLIPEESGSKKSEEDKEAKTKYKKSCDHQEPDGYVPKDTDFSTREAFFLKTLNNLASCTTFTDVHKMCTKIQNEIERQQFNIDYNYFPSILNTGISVDEDSLQIFPKDISQKELLELTPVRIGADGNCLPYTGSVFAFGDQKRAEEIRVRMIIEQTIFKDCYLDQDYLKRGTDNSYTNNALSKTYAMYSDEYIPNERLSLRKVEMVYKQEVMKITKNRSYMGIWQLFSLSSILCRPLFSVYPMLGNPNVRNDLHRLILPRQNIGLETAYVMWTSTRTDMNEKNWVPNHFVAALKDIEMEEKDTIENFDPNDVTPQYLVDRYVLVEYDNKPYPGKVIDCDEAEVYVTCMHRLGKTLRTSTFYWPLAVRDKCWYGMDKIIGVIPEPRLVGQKYFVDNQLWESALRKLNI